MKHTSRGMIMRHLMSRWAAELERRVAAVEIARARLEYYTSQAMLNQDGCRPVEAGVTFMQAAE